MKIKFTNPLNKKRYEFIFRSEFVPIPKAPLDTRLVTRETKNTYEAAYYLISGGEIEKVRARNLPQRIAGKKGFPKQWIVTIKNVPMYAVNLFQSGKAVASVDVLDNTRRRLKREIKRALV